jgi:2-methylaconitate cis-trans-isomerase PrpF
MNKQETESFINNSWRIASLVLGFSSGKCHAALITLCVIGVASPLLVRLCVARSEAF